MTERPAAGGDRMNPRTRRVRRAILDAGIEVLVRDGVHEVTIGRVAEQAEVARTTVYRHWPDQASLLLATIDALTSPHRTPTCDGPLADDLREALEGLCTRLARREAWVVFGALAGYAARDRVFLDAQRRFVEQLIQPTVVALEAAKSRGDLTSTVDCRFEATLLAGPVLYEYLVLQESMTAGGIREVTERWLATHEIV